jgi:hypothetical protein
VPFFAGLSRLCSPSTSSYPGFTHSSQVFFSKITGIRLWISCMSGLSEVVMMVADANHWSSDAFQYSQSPANTMGSPSVRPRPPKRCSPKLWPRRKTEFSRTLCGLAGGPDSLTWQISLR